MPNISFDDIFTLVIILFTLFSVVSGAGRSMSRSQQEARRNAEIERRRRLEEQVRREADPDQQSYEGYLRRTERPDEGPFARTPSPDVRQYVAPDDQDQLRRGMAEKMGRAPTRSFEDDLREAQARAGRPATRPAPPVAPRPVARPDVREGSSLETPAARPASLETLARELSGERLESAEAFADRRAEGQRQIAAVRAARDAELNRAANTAPMRARAAPAATQAAREPVMRGTAAIDTRDIVRAFVMSEILGPPRSRHREPRR